MSDISFRRGESRDPRLLSRQVRSNEMGSLLGTQKSPDQPDNESHLKRRPCLEETPNRAQMITPSLSSSQRPSILSSPRMASLPYRVDPASPQSSQSSRESGGTPRKKKKKTMKYTPQNNTLLNYFAGDPSPRSAIDLCSPTKRHFSPSEQRLKESGHKPGNLQVYTHKRPHHGHYSQRWSPDKEYYRGSHKSTGSPLPVRYHASNSRSHTSTWERQDRQNKVWSSGWSHRRSSCEEEISPSRKTCQKSSPDVIEAHSTNSQPLPDRTSKSLLRFRRFSGGSSSGGSGSEKNKSFPIIRPLVQTGPSYDEILKMAKENVDKQKSERKAEHHHKTGLSSPGKLVHMHEIDVASCNSDFEKSKSETKHRHSSGSDIRISPERLLAGKAKHTSRSDKESGPKRLSCSSDNHLSLVLNKKIYREMMQRSPVVRMVKINTPSPVEVTEELLKRCGSPVVHSDGGLSKCSSNQKGRLKRHHSADDSGSDNSHNYLQRKTLLKQKHVSSLSGSSSHASDMDPPSEKQAKNGESDNSSCNNQGERSPQDRVVTDVRQLFRELSTPSSGSSDSAESGPEENITANAKLKLKWNEIHLDIDKLKSKMQPLSKIRSLDEEPMEIGTDSDGAGLEVLMPALSDKQSESTQSKPLVGANADDNGKHTDFNRTSLSPTPDAQKELPLLALEVDYPNATIKGSVVNDSLKQDSDKSTQDITDVNDVAASTEAELSNLDKYSRQQDDVNDVVAGTMAELPNPEGSTRQSDDNAIRPRSLETLLANVENSQSDGEDLFSSDDDSDDDFLMAKPSALEEIVQLSTLPLPETPEKSSQISNDSMQSPYPASPIQPRTERSKKLKFTLDSMVDIRAKHDGDNADVPDLRGYIKNSMTENKAEGKLDAASLTDLKANLQAKVNQYKIDNEQIPALHPGEDVFDSRRMGELFSFPATLSLQDCGFNPLKLNAMEKLLLNASPDEIIELINAQCLKEVYAVKACPDSVMLWLFQLMSIHPSVYVTQNCFQTLWYLLTSCLSIHPNADPWVPLLRDVTRVFLNYGSNFETLFPASLVQPGFGMDDVRCVRGKENDASSESDRKSSKAIHYRGNAALPTVNLIEVIKTFTQVLITHGLKGRGTCYPPDELQCFLFLVCKTALDKQLIGCAVQVDFQLCISAILECFDDNIWDRQVIEVCQTLSSLSDHHHNLVYVVQLMPTNTQRGRLMRRQLSYAMLQKILSAMSFPAGNAAQFGEYGKWEWLNSSEIKVSDLLPILHACKPDAETDYYQLNSVITLIDLGVGNEPLKSLEKEDLERLIQKLRELTGDIKDGFRYMNRTQVKDLMLRTVNKMTVLSQSMVSRQAQLYRYAQQNTTNSYSVTTTSSSDEKSTVNKTTTDDTSHHIFRFKHVQSLSSLGLEGVSQANGATGILHTVQTAPQISSATSALKVNPVDNASEENIEASITSKQQTSSQSRNNGSSQNSKGLRLSPWRHPSILFSHKQQIRQAKSTSQESVTESESNSTQLSYSPHYDDLKTDFSVGTMSCASEDLKLSLDYHLESLGSPGDVDFCSQESAGNSIITAASKATDSYTRNVNRQQDGPRSAQRNIDSCSNGKELNKCLSPWNHPSILFAHKTQKSLDGDTAQESGSTQLSYSPHSAELESDFSFGTPSCDSNELKVSLENHLEALGSSIDNDVSSQLRTAVECVSFDRQQIGANSLAKFHLGRELDQPKEDGSDDRPDKNWATVHKENLASNHNEKDSSKLQSDVVIPDDCNSQSSLDFPSDEAQYGDTGSNPLDDFSDSSSFETKEEVDILSDNQTAGISQSDIFMSRPSTQSQMSNIFMSRPSIQSQLSNIFMSRPSTQSQMSNIFMSRPSTQSQMSDIFVDRPSTQSQMLNIFMSRPSTQSQMSNVFMSRPSTQSQMSNIFMGRPSTQYQMSNIFMSRPSTQSQMSNVFMSRPSTQSQMSDIFMSRPSTQSQEISSQPINTTSQETMDMFVQKSVILQHHPGTKQCPSHTDIISGGVSVETTAQFPRSDRLCSSLHNETTPQSSKTLSSTSWQQIKKAPDNTNAINLLSSKQINTISEETADMSVQRSVSVHTQRQTGTAIQNLVANYEKSRMLQFLKTKLRENQTAINESITLSPRRKTLGNRSESQSNLKENTGLFPTNSKLEPLKILKKEDVTRKLFQSVSDNQRISNGNDGYFENVSEAHKHLDQSSTVKQNQGKDEKIPVTSKRLCYSKEIHEKKKHDRKKIPTRGESILQDKKKKANDGKKLVQKSDCKTSGARQREHCNATFVSCKGANGSHETKREPPRIINYVPEKKKEPIIYSDSKKGDRFRTENKEPEEKSGTACSKDNKVEDDLKTS